MRTVLVLLLVIVAAAAVSIPSAMQCPEIADAHVASGWQEYRAGRMGSAHRAFAAAHARCPGHPDSQVGLGYVALRNLSLDSAQAYFDRVLGRDSLHVEALIGRGLTEWRTEEYESARATFRRALRIDPSRHDVVEHLGKLPAPLRGAPEREPLLRPDTLEYHARVNGEQLEVRTATGWQRFYVNGVNLGAALPGHFPSEFPELETYRGWVREIAAMGANTVRVYTLHPPAFYEALAEHNAAHPDRPLWLLHGVWAELPPGDDYRHREWQREFFGDMEQVVDVLHGRADVKHRPGRASGHYTADVSRWTLGFILGREWEPFSVAAFNTRHPEVAEWQGRYVGIGPSTPMDAWLTQALEHVVAYETAKYHAQRPVAYTNWPTLDPMLHPTELDARTELEIRGMAYDRSRVVHNEDEVAIGAVPVQATAEFPAGYFVAYHIYPYYPDFFVHDPDYGKATSPYGPSSYYGYLADLRRHVSGVPLLIAEYGIPTSWGISHFNPQGWHHGGHGEAEAAAINVRLTREIAAAGMAGGILFSWIDEWFKHNWLLEPFEQPNERSRMWWNRMNPEQHYGVLAVEPVRRLGESLRDRARGWDTVPALYASDGGRLRAHADEAYLWLYVQGAAVRAERLVIGLDIVEPDAGGMRLPGAGAPTSPVGLEFVLVVDSGQARLRATPRAQQYRLEAMPKGATARDRRVSIRNWAPGMFMGSWMQSLNEPFLLRAADDGRFDPLLVAVNRARVGADSTNWSGYGYDRGVLPEGPLPDGAWERSPESDALEVRIPWNLVNVTDPSSRHVVLEPEGARPDERVGTAQVDAIRITLATQDGAGAWQAWPASGLRSDVASFTWPTWDEPRYRVRRRPVFAAMSAVYRELSHTESRKASLP